MIRIDVVYTGLEGMPAVNGLYFAGDNQTAADEAAAAVSGWITDLQPVFSTSVSVDVSNTATQINEATGTIVDFHAVDGATIQGTSTADPLPIGTSAIFRFRTNAVVRGRRLQGRVFLPGMTESMVPAGGVLDAGGIAGLILTAAENLGGPSGVHVVWSRPVDGGPAGTTAPVTVYDVPAVLTSLRSRRR